MGLWLSVPVGPFRIGGPIGGRKRKRAHPQPNFSAGAVMGMVLALASLGYGMLHHWWVDAVVGGLVVGFGALVVCKAYPRGQRRRFLPDLVRFARFKLRSKP